MSKEEDEMMMMLQIRVIDREMVVPLKEEMNLGKRASYPGRFTEVVERMGRRNCFGAYILYSGRRWMKNQPRINSMP